MKKQLLRRSARAFPLAALSAVAAFLLVAALGASSSTAAARATLPRNTSPPTISGTARDGKTLTGSRGSWSGTQPISYSYQWIRCSERVSDCNPIPGATNETYTLNSNDVGRTLIFFVRAKNSAGGGSAGSGATGVVAKRGNSPANTSPPTFSGTPQQGQTLTGARGSWTGTQPISYTYRWERCNPSGGSCADINGARSPSYTLSAADVAQTVRLRVTASNSVGNTNATSVPSAVVSKQGSGPVNTAPPTISGTPQQGQTLTAAPGSWTGTKPLAYAFQWRRCNQGGGSCADISGATSATYLLTSADVGNTLRVRETASNSVGRKAATSVPSAVVSKAGVPAGGAIAIGDVSLPNRLIIDRVSFRPNPLRSRRQTLIARFRVSDSRQHVVQGALVFLLGIPYGQMSVPSEQVTGPDGYVTFRLHPKAKFSLRSGALVFFVRARKPGENLLGGVSTRRLVQLNLR